MGLSTAYALSRALPNAQITIFDSNGFPANNASFIAGGMLTPYSELDHMPAAYLPAAAHSITLWADMSEKLGNNFEFAQNGSLLIAHNEDRYLLERYKSILPANDQNWRAVNAREISDIEPALPAQKFPVGLNIKREAHLNPRLAMDALCKAIENKHTTELNIDKASQTHNYVIDCRGMRSKTDIPELRGVKGEVLVVHNPEFTLARPVRLMHPRYPLYIVPRADNVFLIGATIIESANNKTVSIRSGLELLSALYSLHPSFADAHILEMRADIRPALPDNMPAITLENNIIRANGLYRHGFLLAPVMAQCISALITNKTNEYLPLFLKGDHSHADHSERQAAYA